jgi:hypothetical protein
MGWASAEYNTRRGRKNKGSLENPVDMKRDVSERTKGQALMKRNI